MAGGETEAEQPRHEWLEKWCGHDRDQRVGQHEDVRGGVVAVDRLGRPAAEWPHGFPHPEIPLRMQLGLPLSEIK